MNSEALLDILGLHQEDIPASHATQVNLYTHFGEPIAAMIRYEKGFFLRFGDGVNGSTRIDPLPESSGIRVSRKALY